MALVDSAEPEDVWERRRILVSLGIERAGLELLSALRENEAFKDLPFFVVTVEADLNLIQKTLDLGATDYREITQEQINKFADATGDDQWIHVDPERAQDGPFGAPIAHGFLTLSLIIPFWGELFDVDQMMHRIAVHQHHPRARRHYCFGRGDESIGG